MNAKEISIKRFEKSAFGYKADDVDEYLRDLAGEMSQLQKDKDDCEKKIDVLADKVREYMKDEDAIKDAIVGAQRQSRQIIDEAQMVSNRIIAEANEKADRTIGQTRIQLDKEKTALFNTQRAVSDFKAKLLSLYKSHLDLITAMPETDESDDDANYQSQQALARDEEVDVEQPEQILNEEPIASDAPNKQESPFHQPQGGRQSQYGELKFGQKK